MRIRLCALAALFTSALLAAPALANASELIARNATNVTLKVNAQGQALVSYDAGGKHTNVLVWGAVNAIAPTQSRSQVAFRIDYSGGWGAFHQKVWQGFRNVCAPYQGPGLAWHVTSCTSPDGTHWALQAWQRMLPNYGLRPNAKQASWELRLSHWSGPAPELTVSTNWAYRRFDHIYGTFSYQGKPVHGFASTPSGVPLDTFGRNLYVDTFNSAYGPGWHRENSFLMHRGSGAFCYGFYKHGARPAGNGTKYRATIIGPGVTPDVMWNGSAPGAYDAELDRQLADHQRQVLAGDALCKPV